MVVFRNWNLGLGLILVGSRPRLWSGFGKVNVGFIGSQDLEPALTICGSKIGFFKVPELITKG